MRSSAVKAVQTDCLRCEVDSLNRRNCGQKEVGIWRRWEMHWPDSHAASVRGGLDWKGSRLAGLVGLACPLVGLVKSKQVRNGF